MSVKDADISVGRYALHRLGWIGEIKGMTTSLAYIDIDVGDDIMNCHRSDIIATAKTEKELEKIMNLTSLRLDHIELISNLAKPPDEIYAKLNDNRVDLMHAAFGIAGEVFELQEGAIRMDQENIEEELGDLLFYIRMMKLNVGIPNDHIAFACSLSLNECLQRIALIAARVHDQIKKFIIYNKIPEPDSFKDNLLLLESVVCYFAKFIDKTEELVTFKNIQKLETRYSKGYSDKAAQERKDKENEN